MKQHDVADVAWQILDDHARLVSPRLQICLNVIHPDQGLQVERFDGRSISGLNILRIAPDPPTPPEGETLDERYVRGDDLVVGYAQTHDRTSRPQVYWRHLEADEGAAGIELTLSIQTSLLSSRPAIHMLSQVPASEVAFYDAATGVLERLPVRDGSPCRFEPRAGLFLFRLTDGETSYAESVSPSDLEGAELETGNGMIRLSYRLFANSLEKGVIRRGRVRAMLMDRARDEWQAVNCCEAFLAAPPRLTT